MNKGGAVATETIIKSMMPILVLITIYIIAKKFFNSTIGIIGDVATETGQGLDLGNKIGVTKTGAQVKTATDMHGLISKFNSNEVSNPFLPTYLSQLQAGLNPNLKVSLITRASADRLARLINGADGFFSYSPAQFINAFKECKTKSAISMVADSYSRIYGSLWAFMQSFEGAARKEAALLEVLQYVNKLPKGVTNAAGKIVA